MKIFLAITYALFVPGLMLFINFEIKRTQLAKFHQINIKRATQENNYQFFYQYDLGWHRPDKEEYWLYADENKQLAIKVFELYLPVNNKNIEKDDFDHEMICVFVTLKDEQLFRKNLYLILTGIINAEEKIVAEPLYLSSYKGANNILTTTYTNGMLIIPKHYFIKHKGQNITINNINIVVENNKSKTPINKTALDIIYKGSFNQELFLQRFQISNIYQALNKQTNSEANKLYQALANNNIYPPAIINPQDLPDYYRSLISFYCFYLAGVILVSYAIFVLPRDICFFKKYSRKKETL